MSTADTITAQMIITAIIIVFWFPEVRKAIIKIRKEKNLDTLNCFGAQIISIFKKIVT